MPSHRRSIYIGLGGLGVQVISKVKEFFNEKDEILPMIKYLGIDTNNHELQNSNLNNEELVFLRTCNPIALFQAQSQSFPWMPDENKGYITSLSGYGSGQIRSNGRFAFEVNRNIIYERLQRYYDELMNIPLGMADILYTPNIDIHVVSSIAGGTGSGIVIEFAKVIKEAIPNSNVMGYFFSDSFFQSIGIGWNIKANAYATLFELNSEMSSSNKPFDVCLYIDNVTDSRNEKLEQYIIDLDSAINSTVSTMCMITSFGNGHWSFFDDVKAAMTSGIYNQGQRMAWITSIGSSAISYNREELNDCLLHISALQFTRSLLDNISFPTQTCYLIEKIRESFYELEAACKEFVPPAWVVVDDNGTIIDECVQHDLKHYYCSKEDELCKWREDVRVAISNHILDLLKSNALNLHNIECFLSELMNLFNELKYHNSEEQRQLYVEKRHMEHMLEEDSQALHRMLNMSFIRFTRRTSIINLKNKICATKEVILKDEREIIRKDKIKEALSIIQIYCSEEIERNKRLIQCVNCVIHELEEKTNNYHLKRMNNGLDINLTTLLIHELSRRRENINVSWDSVRENLFNSGLDSAIHKEQLIHLISQNCEINLNYNNLLVNIENFDIYIKEMLRKSEVMLNVDYNGDTVIHDESLVISTPLGLDQFINNIVANQLNINGFIIVQGEENEIRAYKTAFLFAPHSICRLNVNESYTNSKKTSVIETLKQGRYSPFTDKNYQNLYNTTKGL